MTINAVCGSGPEGRDVGAQAIRDGDFEDRDRRAVRKLSMRPLLPGSRDGQRMGDWKLVDSMIVDGLLDVYNNTTWASPLRMSRRI